MTFKFCLYYLPVFLLLGCLQDTLPEKTAGFMYMGKNPQGYTQYLRQSDSKLMFLVDAEEFKKQISINDFGKTQLQPSVDSSPIEKKPAEVAPKELTSGPTAIAEKKPAEVAPKELTSEPTAIAAKKPAEVAPKELTSEPTAIAAKKPAEVDSEELTFEPTTTTENKPAKEEVSSQKQKSQKKYFWHGQYHSGKHSVKCNDMTWHPYLAKELTEGDFYQKIKEKYRLIEASEGYKEEIDVTSYPQEHQWVYKNIIRVQCNQCHSPARYFNRRFTPPQWRIALKRIQSLGMIPPLEKEWENRLWSFFSHYEEQRLQEKEDEEESEDE